MLQYGFCIKRLIGFAHVRNIDGLFSFLLVGPMCIDLELLLICGLIIDIDEASS